MPNSAANNPSDTPVDFQGAVRNADGYAYWTTSEEDEAAVEKGDRKDPSHLTPTAKAKAPRRPGAMRRWGIRFASLLLVSILAAIVYFGVTYTQVESASEKEEATQVDAIVVLGAAQYDGSPSYVLQERLDHAFNLWSDGYAPIIMTTGAGQEGDITTEGLVGLTHLLEKDVPEDAILVIPEGTNTWEQLSASAYQLELRDLESVLLVSDNYHSYRLLDIADELGIEAYVSPSAVEPESGNFLRESAAVAIGRITGYRRLSSLTEAG